MNNTFTITTESNTHVMSSTVPLRKTQIWRAMTTVFIPVADQVMSQLIFDLAGACEV